jgi:hypothetical protein
MGSLRGTITDGERVPFPYELWIPTVSSNMTYGSARVLDGSGEYVDWQFQAEAGKAIASFLARFGTITAGDASTPFELNDIDQAPASPPSRPGSTVHASGTIDTTAGGLANTSRLFTFGSAYTPAKAALLAAKVGWAGSQNLQMIPTADKGAQAFPFSHDFIGAAHNGRANILIFGVKYSDGTWMRIPWAFPAAAFGTTGFQSGSAANEHGQLIRMVGSKMVDTVLAFFDADANDQYICRIRDANRVQLASGTFEGDLGQSITYGPKALRLDTPVHMRAGKDYYVTFESLTANNIDLQYVDVYEAAAMSACLGNSNCKAVSRLNSGDPAFDVIAGVNGAGTRKYFIGVEGYSVSR